MSFEKAMQQLEAIVQELEKGELTLEKSLKRFEEGVRLTRFCSKTLADTEKKITMLLGSSEDDLSEIPFEDDNGSAAQD